MNLFRQLNDLESRQFRNWARENYKLNSEIKEEWHPVVKDECSRMNKDLPPFTYYVKFSAGVYQNETGVLENRKDSFYIVIPDSAPHLRLAVREEEFEII